MPRNIFPKPRHGTNHLNEKPNVPCYARAFLRSQVVVDLTISYYIVFHLMFLNDITSYSMMSYHIMSYDIKSYFSILDHSISYRGLLYYVILYSNILYHTMTRSCFFFQTCYVMLYDMRSYHIIS